MTLSPPQGAIAPNPEGWFALCFSRDLQKGSSVQGNLAAQPYLLARQPGGIIEYSGAVTQVVEQNGFILGWHHPERKPPKWQVPPIDESFWRPAKFHQLEASSHPQEIFENSIDIAHFPTIHHYSDISVLKPMTTWNHTMSVRYAIARKSPVPWSAKRVRAEFEVFLHGIGCSHNTIDLPIGGLQVKMLVFATPTTTGQVTIRLGVTIPKTTKNPFLRLLLPIIHKAVLTNIVHDFEQDCAIWNNKVFLSPPVLVATDGPIGDFRRWCQRFYKSAEGASDVL